MTDNRTPPVLIAGGGIGGLTAALMLQRAGIACTVFEQALEPRELGVGINILPPAVKELVALGLLAALDRQGIRTHELIYANRFGQTVWREFRGLDAGLDMPQFSIHRGKLYGLLMKAVQDRLGPSALRTGCSLIDFERQDNKVIARVLDRNANKTVSVKGAALVGADGIHSAVRRQLYPEEGQPLWNGTLLWRGATDWPVWLDGRTMIIAGGMSAKFVFYPIHVDPSRPAHRLTNWAIMAKMIDSDLAASGGPPHKEDWNRAGQLADVAAFLRDRFFFDFVDPLALISSTEEFFEYPLCDRDPLDRWSFDRVTLLGDAAHPMYPVGSNGATQAILDAACLARHLQTANDLPSALAAYEAERRPLTGQIVLANRKGGPERIIDVMEMRAPDGFDDVDAIVPRAEREAIVRGQPKGHRA